MARKEEATQIPRKRKVGYARVSRRHWGRVTEQKRGKMICQSPRLRHLSNRPRLVPSHCIIKVTEPSQPCRHHCIPFRQGTRRLTEVNLLGLEETANKGPELAHTSLRHTSLPCLSAFNPLPSL